MAGVATIYVARKLSSTKALAIYALIASIVGIALFTSLPHILANLIHAESAGLPAVALFLLSAVTKTNLSVQAALLVAIFAGFFLLRETFRPQRSRYA